MSIVVGFLLKKEKKERGGRRINNIFDETFLQNTSGRTAVLLLECLNALKYKTHQLTYIHTAKLFQTHNNTEYTETSTNIDTIKWLLFSKTNVLLTPSLWKQHNWYKN